MKKIMLLLLLAQPGWSAWPDDLNDRLRSQDLQNQIDQQNKDVRDMEEEIRRDGRRQEDEMRRIADSVDRDRRDREFRRAVERGEIYDGR